MNDKDINVMVINVDPLAFTVPTQIDSTRFMVNVFHKDYPSEMYGILVINTLPSLDFVFFRNDKHVNVDDKIVNATNMMKEYIMQTLKINGEPIKVVDSNYNFGSDLSIQMGIDIQKNGPDGKPEVDDDGKPIIKHIEVNQKLN